MPDPTITWEYRERVWLQGIAHKSKPLNGEVCE
jgi:hypothetical protein